MFITECHPGSWGVNCMKKCRCQNDAKCDAETGECICADGWFGRECEEGDLHEINFSKIFNSQSSFNFV